MPDSGIEAHVNAVWEADAAIPGARDYRRKNLHAAIALAHGLCALALSIERFAIAITPPQEETQ